MNLWSIPLFFAGNLNFENKLRLYTFNIQFMYDFFPFYYEKHYIYIL